MSANLTGLILSSMACGAASLDGPLPCGYTVDIIPPPWSPVFGFAEVQPLDVNDSGVVVGHFGWIGDQHPFMWSTQEGFRALTPPPGLAIVDASASAINNNGWVVVTASHSVLPMRGYVLPTPEAWIRIDPDLTNGWSQLSDINDANVVVGEITIGSSEEPEYPQAGLIWNTADGKKEVSVAPGPSTSFKSINNEGVVVGWTGAAIATPGTVGFVIEGAVTTLMPPIPGGTTSVPFFVDDGGVAVGIGLLGAAPDTTVRGFVYANGIMEATIEPLRGFTKVQSFGSGAGLATGRAFGGVTSDVGYIWSTTDGMVEVLQLVEGIELLTVSDVGRSNSHGMLIAEGARPSPRGGLHTAMLLTPTSPTPDIDCNGSVDSADLSNLVSHWNSSNVRCDIDGDGVVAGSDLGALLAAWTPIPD